MKYIFGILLILMTLNCEAQKRKNFYTMEIDGIINLGRTNFNRQDVIDRSGPLAFYSRRQYPKRISLGLSSGIGIYIPIKNNWQIGIRYAYERKGQRSSKLEINSDRYSFKYMLESRQVSVINRVYLKNRVFQLNQFLESSLILDQAINFWVKSYIHNEFGKQNTGYSTSYYTAATKRKYFRAGLGLGYGLEYQKINFVTLKLISRLKYYTNIIGTEDVPIVRGNGVLIEFGIAAGLKIKN